MRQGIQFEVRRLGIPDYFVEHGTQEELYRECGYDAEGIEIAIQGDDCEEGEKGRKGEGVIFFEFFEF